MAAAGALRVARSRARTGLTILMYHRVLPAAEAAQTEPRNLVVDAECFARQMDELARTAEVVTVGEAMAGGESGLTARTGRPRVAVTFDDGYLDNAEHAAPIMEARGLRGTFFVTSGFVAGTPMWLDRAVAIAAGEGGAGLRAELDLPASAPLDPVLGRVKRRPADERDAILDRHANPSDAASDAANDAPGDAVSVAACPPAMRPADLQRLAGAGHEIGGHTVTHPILIHEEPARIRRELAENRAALEEWAGVPVTGLAWPNGDADETVRAIARECGYAWSCATRRGRATAVDDPMDLPRRMIGPCSAPGHAVGSCRAAFAAEVWGVHDGLRRLIRRFR